MCIEREKDNFKSREINCLKECALALNKTRADQGVGINTTHLKILHALKVLHDTTRI